MPLLSAEAGRTNIVRFCSLCVLTELWTRRATVLARRFVYRCRTQASRCLETIRWPVRRVQCGLQVFGMCFINSVPSGFYLWLTCLKFDSKLDKVKNKCKIEFQWICMVVCVPVWFIRFASYQMDICEETKSQRKKRSDLQMVFVYVTVCICHFPCKATGILEISGIFSPSHQTHSDAFCSAHR